MSEVLSGLWPMTRSHRILFLYSRIYDMYRQSTAGVRCSKLHVMEQIKSRVLCHVSLNLGDHSDIRGVLYSPLSSEMEINKAPSSP